MEKDDPWQYLAACIEVTNAVRSGNPHTFVSHLPIHQDGTCNGLQHYAAIGKDEDGSKSVNVLPSDRPQDVYNDVSKRIEVSASCNGEREKLTALFRVRLSMT